MSKALLQALSIAGINIPSSCEQGICRTCIIDVVQGEIEHRDLFLTEEEQRLNTQMITCCSRAKSKVLMIDVECI